MSIRRKTILIIGGTLTALIVVLFVASQIILLSRFEQLEAQSVQRNMQRVLNAIDNELTSLSATNADWAHWDDTYFYAQGENETYTNDNLSNDALANLSLNVMAFVDAAGDTLFVKSIDLESWEDMPLPAGFDAYLQPGSPLLNHADEASDLRVIVLLPETAMLITSRPILTSQKEGPIVGSMIFGRIIDEAKIAALSESLELSLTADRYDDSQLPADFQRAATLLSADTPTVSQPINTSTIAGYAALTDLNNDPALLLSVEMPRDILARGKTSIAFFVLSLIAISIAGGVLTVILLERFVLSRLARLGTGVDAISTSGDLSSRVTVDGEDELASLGARINEMLHALELAQEARQKSDERLRTVVNSAPIVLWALDTEERFTLVDGTGLNALDIVADTIIGKTVAELDRKLPITQDTTEQSLAGSEVSSTATINGLTFATQYTPLKDQNGDVTGVIGVATNITGRVVAEQALADAIQQLEHKNRLLERAQELIRSSVEQLSDAVGRGAGTDELRSLVAFMHNHSDA